MNKKNYLALIQEYESTIEEKCFNPNFYNGQRLEELKEIIIHQLSIHEHRCLNQDVRCMYAPLVQRIKDGESIQGYEYEKCYMELYIGPLKLNHFLFLLLMGGLALVVRSCLSYLGLL